MQPPQQAKWHFSSNIQRSGNQEDLSTKTLNGAYNHHRWDKTERIGNGLCYYDDVKEAATKKNNNKKG
jgi:hypothetical protein